MGAIVERASIERASIESQQSGSGGAR